MNIQVAENSANVFRKFGVAGFTFFLVKGVLWLVAPFVLAWFL